MKERMTIGFMFKQINTIYEKDFNQLLRNIGITASQCAVLDYLFCSSEEAVNQRDIEKALSLRNPTVTGLLKRLDEEIGRMDEETKEDEYLSLPSNVDGIPVIWKYGRNFRGQNIFVLVL